MANIKGGKLPEVQSALRIANLKNKKQKQKKNKKPELC